MAHDNTAQPSWDAIAIVGVGLIGGSVGLAAREKGVARRVIGVGRTPLKLQAAIDAGAIDEVSTNLSEAAAVADLIVICTPVDRVAEMAILAATKCRPGTLITDAGSTKSEIVATIESQLPHGAASFVGSHPLAGGENQGVEFAKADLFDGKLAIVTPTAHSRSDDVSAIERFWRRLGSDVRSMSPAEHDRIVAGISHLPHLVAAALAAGTCENDRQFAAKGWCDTTRVAGGDPELWRQIFSQNRRNVLASLTEFERWLAEFRGALEAADGEALARLLKAGKHARDPVGS